MSRITERIFVAFQHSNEINILPHTSTNTCTLYYVLTNIRVDQDNTIARGNLMNSIENNAANINISLTSLWTRITTLVTHYLQQPLSASTYTTNNWALESGWVFSTDSNTHPLNYHRHLAFLKNELPGTLSNHSKHINFLWSKNFRQVLCICHGYHLPSDQKLSDQTSRTIAFGSTKRNAGL